MKGIKKYVSVILALVVALAFSLTAFAEANPSINVQNGSIRRYGTTPGSFVVDSDFSGTLAAGQVRVSQQVITDYDDGRFDVELRVQGEAINLASEQAIVFVLDDSSSITPTQWSQLINACVEFIDTYPAEASVYFGIVTFATTAIIRSNLTTNRQSVINTLRNMARQNTLTNTGDGLIAAKTVLDSYRGSGTKTAIVITDGGANEPAGSATQHLQNSATALKNSNVTVYAIGIGAYNQNELNTIASSIPGQTTVFTMTNFSQLAAALAALATKIDVRGVTIVMGADFDYVSIVSGSGYSYNDSTKTLFWTLQNVNINTLVYRIRMKQSSENQGFKPVSSSAVVTYTDANTVSRTESFDIPTVRVVSEFNVIFRDWDGKLLSEQKVKNGEAAVAPANPTRTGYTFTGWDRGFSNITEDLTVTALYTINYYNVTFFDWNGTILGTQSVAYLSAATVPTDPDNKVGWHFVGWDKDFSEITGNLDVTALYEINYYDVTFKNWNGVTLDIQSIAHGSAATAPDVPERNGYAFTGWDQDFSEVISDMLVTTIWKPYLALNAESATVTLTATLKAASDLPAAANAQLILAVYDANGKMLTTVFETVSYNDAVVTKTLTAVLPEGAKAKAFLWDENWIPLFEACEL